MSRAAPFEIVFDRQSVRQVDRVAIEEFGIPGIVLMENAARGLLAQALEMLGDARGTSLIFCGSGNNGGDGYALARHLHNHGATVALVSLGEPMPEGDAGINRIICQRMKLAEAGLDDLDQLASVNHIGLIVDAIFGTGLDRPVTGRSEQAIDWINRANRPVLAVDLPSGMDCDTGKPLGSCARATRTVTFVGQKVGFLNLEAQRLLGEVVVADIGAPIELLQRFGRTIALDRRDGSTQDQRKSH